MLSLEIFGSAFSVIVLAFIFYLLLNLWFFGDGKKMKSLHKGKSFKDIFRGKLYRSFSDKRNPDIIAGFSLKRNKSTGKIDISPTGTYSNQAVHKTISK